MTGATQPATSIVTAKSVDQFVNSLLMVRVLRCKRARGDAMPTRLACFLGFFVFRVMIGLLCDNAYSRRRQKTPSNPHAWFLKLRSHFPPQQTGVRVMPTLT
jgi:hypothetical protein